MKAPSTAVLLVAALLVAAQCISATPSKPNAEAVRCGAVRASEPVVYRGRTLVEVPDVTDPYLRHIYALQNAACHAEYYTRLEPYGRLHPDDPASALLTAYGEWVAGDDRNAELMLLRLLVAHPDFLSAKVMLSSLAYHQGRFDEVQRLLDEVEPKAPNDLWVFMNRLRLEARRGPSRELLGRLLEIARNDAFPPNARDEAAWLARNVPGQTNDEIEQILRLRFSIDSMVPLPCKAEELALWLSEVQGKFGDTIELLESSRAVEGGCTALPKNRIFLAQAYLMKAASINAVPSAANEHLVRRALEVLNGDLTGLAGHAMSRPQGPKLRPFLAALTHPAETDDAGRTQICNAVLQMNPDAVLAQLEAGADPNGECEGKTLVSYMFYMATTKHVARRQAVLGHLLAHGAEPVDIEVCRGSDNCSQVLLPLVEQYTR